MNKTYNIEVIHIIKEKTILIKCKIMNFSFLIIKLKLNSLLKIIKGINSFILNLQNDAINKRRFLKISFKEKVINLINYKVEKKIIMI